jgi:hypothetical protein
MARVAHPPLPVVMAALLAPFPGWLQAQQASVPALPQAPPAPWSLHAQATWIDQANPSFPSPYEGLNSFKSQPDSERTFSSSL